MLLTVSHLIKGGDKAAQKHTLAGNKQTQKDIEHTATHTSNTFVCLIMILLSELSQ